MRKVMASSSGPLNEELLCSICLDVSTDLIAAPCGHNFCRTCLNKFWTNTQTFYCPSCKETSSAVLGVRQTLQSSQVNMILRSNSSTPEYIAESFAQHFNDKLNIGRPKVLCDICHERKQKAVKSCLTCQSSYCETHLEPHHRVQRLKKHTLINAVENLETYICHEKPLEPVCRDDQKERTEGDHRTYNSVPIEQESQEKALSSEMESAARALIDVLARGLAPSSSTASPTLPEPENRVRQALKRQFQSMFETENDQPWGKKRLSVAKPGNVKKTDFLIYVLSKPTLVTPKVDEDLKLVHAGLGKRLLTVPDGFKHSEIVSLLEEEFPKLKTVQGGWMFYKRTGERRKLTIIPTDSDGYSTRLLKSVSNNGKNTLYVVPLQEQLSTEPLPFDSVEFAKMPQSKCMKCERKIPLPLLPLHVKECNESVTDAAIFEDEDVSGATDQPSSLHTDLDQSSQICPICQVSFPADVLPYHASTCGEGGWTFSGSDSPSTSTREEWPRPSTAHIFTSLSSGWKYESDPQKACRMFCDELLNQNKYCPSLSLVLDAVDEQDSELISFYKMNSTNWSAPLTCRLTGDAAVGTGVKRHVLSMVMQKVKTGFTLNLGSSTSALFEGEKNHRVPSASAVLRDSDLFQMAGRMIGHSFLHGGPCLSGLSLSVVILLTGGNPDSAVSALTLQDCPDLDHRETIRLKTKLTKEEKSQLTDLCLFWDLPVPSSSNRDWLFQQLLSHAVLGRVKRQIKDLRKGIKDTGIWPLLSQRQDSHDIVFPRESARDVTSQGILQKIVWPKAVDYENKDNDESITVEKMCVITGYIRRFIEEASPTMLNHLMKFWVGWELPEENLTLELVNAKFPVAYTCFKTLRLPCHYKSYAAFRVDMLMCLNSVNSGFGLV
ncbi:uncharacterized protein LOC122332742 isoform X3 [Puntigrus tetrazona]|uniref:uncharacterized protein LOC122332742 isoform X3 n=1 Tax=Puntigrus tetrazona TaxID=1606681 RepID=UPI001C88EB30|nr:uncharacterized protein LOC122332742 isoform X3 [Puntigrus tetrazona]